MIDVEADYSTRLTNEVAAALISRTMVVIMTVDHLKNKIMKNIISFNIKNVTSNEFVHVQKSGKFVREVNENKVTFDSTFVHRGYTIQYHYCY